MKPDINNLNSALTYHLEGMYDAEKRLQKGIPGCLKLASSSSLKGELKNYLESTSDKRLKLKRVFSYLLAGPFGRKNKAIGKMLRDVEDFSNRVSAPELNDAVLIACLQEINHYKISAYHTAIAFSMELGLDPVTDLLTEVLQWEKSTGQALSKMAIKGVNKRAKSLVM